METKRHLTRFIIFESLILLFLLFTLYSCNQGPAKNVEESYSESAESSDKTYIDEKYTDVDSTVVISSNPEGAVDAPPKIAIPDELGTSIRKDYNGTNYHKISTRNPGSKNDHIKSTEYLDYGSVTVSPNTSKKIPHRRSPAVPDDNYKVILATSPEIFKNETCELKIWIGAEKIEVTFSEGMITDQTSIPATIGQYAKITPYAPDFEVSPAQMTCVKIDPSGSEVRFTLKPKSSGKFKVSANIELFDNPDCTGPAIPKTAKTLSVEVKTNTKFVVLDGLQKMGAVVWDKFMSFWGIVITLFFAAALFVIRRFVKKKTGYDDTLGN